MEILNCQKPKGLEALRQNKIALRAVEQQTVIRFLPIADDKPSRIDGFIHDTISGLIVGSYEVKTRNYSKAKLETTYKNEWMISWSKIQAALDITRHTKLPFYGILHLEPDNLVMMLEIFNSNGTWGCNTQMRDVLMDGVTQKMAFLNMGDAVSYAISDSNALLEPHLF